MTRTLAKLEVLLAGCPADDLDEFRKTLLNRKISPDTVARALQEYKEYEQQARDYAPIDKAGRRFSEQRQRLRKRLGRVLADTMAMYKKELRASVLGAQPGYRAARALCEALGNNDDPIVGPFMNFSPKSSRGPRKHPSRPPIKEILKHMKLDDQADFLIQGLFPSKKKK